MNTLPSGAELYQAAQARLAATQATSAEQLAAQPPVAEPGVSPAAPPEELYAPYRARDGITFDVYDPAGKGYRATLDDLMQKRAELANYQLTVTDQGGNRRGIAVGDVDNALRQGMKLEGSHESQIHRFLEDNKGLKGDAKAALMNFADELFLAIPGVVAEHTKNPDELAAIEALKREHGFANALGGLGGFAGSLIAGGPIFKGAAALGGLAERGVTEAATRMMAGRLAEAGVETGAQSLAKRLVAQSLGSAAALGTESAVIAAPKAITEAALGDPEAAGESLLWNFGAGAALGVLGPSAKEIFGHAAKSVFTMPASVQGKLDAYANEQAVKSHNPYLKFSQRLSETPGGEQAAGRTIREYGLVPKAGEDFTGLTERIAQTKEDVGSQIGAKYAELDKYGAIADAKDVARDLRKQVLAPLENSVGFEGKAAKVRRYLDSFLEKTGAAEPPSPDLLETPKMPKLPKQPALPKELRTAPEVPPPPSQVRGLSPEEQARRLVSHEQLVASTRAEYEAKVAEFLKPHTDRVAELRAAHAAEVARVEGVNADRIARYEAAKAMPTELTSKDLLNIRQDLDDLIYGEKLPAPDQVDGSYKAIRGILKKTLDARAGELEGPEFISKLDKLNGDYRVLSILEKNAQKNVGRGMTNRTNSLTDYLTGSGLASAGGAAGAAFAGPMGAAMGAGVGKLVGMFGNKYLRENYNRLAVQGADKLGVLIAEQSMKRAHGELARVPEVIGRLAAGTAREAADAAPPRALVALLGASGSREEQYLHAAKVLDDARADVNTTTAKLADISGGLAEGGAPNIANAYQAKAQTAVDYLWKTMPRPRVTPKLFGSKKPVAPSDREMQAWERRAEIVADPFRVFDHLEKGTLTREHLDALQSVYPALAQKVAERIQLHAADPGAPVLSESMRAQLHPLLGGAQDMKSIRRYQSNFEVVEEADKVKAQSMGGAGGGQQPTFDTPVQRVTMR